MQFTRLSFTCFDLKLVRLIAAFLITPPSHFPSSISTTANLVYHRLDNIIVRNRRETIKSLLCKVTEIKGSGSFPNIIPTTLFAVYYSELYFSTRNDACS